MGKILTMLITLMFISESIAQTVIQDTIYITKGNMSHLIFTDAIAMSDYGSSVVNSDNGKPVITKVNDTYVVIVKARKRYKDPTNISIITKTNVYYDITCMYSEKPVKNFYYFDYGNKVKNAYVDEIKNEKIEEVKPLNEDEKDEEVKAAVKKDSLLNKQFNKFFTDTVKFKGMAKRIYSGRTKRVKGKFARVDKISLELIGIYARKDKIYVKLNLYNGGTLPYHILRWNYHFMKKGGFDPQTIPEYTPDMVFEYNENFQSILPKDKLTKVFVFDQFSMEGNQSLYVQLFEKNGQRNPVIEINSKYINQAYVIKSKK